MRLLLSMASVIDTVEIAMSYGAKVFQRKPWGHVEPDRMFALSKAGYDWILYLDYDELLGRKLKNDIRELVARAEREHYAALSIVRIDYGPRCRQLVFGPFYNRQIRVYNKTRVLYRGVVHELPIVFGNVLELPEEYYILHYPSWPKSKLVFYAYLESLEYYQHATRSKIRKALWKLTPLSASMTVMYNIILNLMMKRNPHINLCTLIRTIDTYSFYEVLVHTLMKFRGGKRERISMFVQKYGLITLLERKLGGGEL